MLTVYNETVFTPVSYNPFAGTPISRIICLSDARMANWVSSPDQDRQDTDNGFITVRFRGVPDLTALQKSVQLLVGAYELLRTVFCPNGHQMLICQDLPIDVQRHDYTNLKPTDQCQAIISYVQQQTQYRFDPVYGPLFSVSLLAASAQNSYLLLTAHPVICNALPATTLIRELGSFYSAVARNKPVAQPSEVISFETAHYESAQLRDKNGWETGNAAISIPTDLPRSALNSWLSQCLTINPEKTLLIEEADDRSTANGRCRQATMNGRQTPVNGRPPDLDAVMRALNRIDDIYQSTVVARPTPAGDSQLIAFVVLQPVATKCATANWKNRWDVIYGAGTRQEKHGLTGGQNLDLAIVEQISNRTDIRDEAEEWLRESINRIRSLKPRRVMEVGCGAGQLLFALAPEVTQYVATDYSQAAIENINEKIEQQPDAFRHVRAQSGSADDFSMLGSDKVDLVLIHSVAQYFPDTAYLHKVIRNAVQVTAPGGCIFIGDMQGRSTLYMHHAHDQFQRATADKTLAQFRQTVNRRVRLEDEFMADPAVFYALPQLIPGIAGVDIQLRKGQYRNETTKYHYDVWLYVDRSPCSVPADVEIDGCSVTLATIDNQLQSNPESVVRVTNLFNQRTASDYALNQLIQNSDESTLIGELKTQMLTSCAGLDPNDCWIVGESNRFQTFVRWSSDGLDNRFEAVFIPASLTGCMPKPSSGVCDNQETEASALQIQRWKRELETSLPDYLMPSEFIVVSE